MNREGGLITHINSYFITSKLHGELVSCLDEKGLRQHVYVPVSDTSLVGKNMPEGLEHGKIHYSHCFGKMDRLLWPLKMDKIWRDFKKWFSPQASGVLHAHSLIVNGLIAYRAYKKWGVPYVVTARNTDINIFLKKLPALKPFAQNVLQKSSAIVVLSPAHRNTLIELINAKNKSFIESKIQVLPNGIHSFWLEKMRPKQTFVKTPTVLFAGTVNNNKNLRGLIRSCEILHKQRTSVKVVVAGTGPLLKKLKNKKHLVKVDFLGQVIDRDHLLEIYRGADLVAVPSFRESFGLVYPEAMSQGLPVIYTRSQGFDGHFPDGQVGYAIDPRSPEEIADRILKIMANYDRFSNNAFAGASRFSWDKVSDSLISIYEAASKQ